MKNNDDYILGVSAFFHDSSACLIKNGKIIAAVQEERFSRIKFDAAFPINSINYCLTYANITINEVNTISYFEDNHLKFDRIIKSYLRFFPFSFLMLIRSCIIWIKYKLLIELKIKSLLKFNNNITFYNHHFSHAASAFYPSPYKEAAILIIDAVGEWDCTSLGVGINNKIEILKNIQYPDSLGMLYSAFTEFSGFKVNSGEYKLMGLAPYGEPIYKDLILKELIKINSDGSYRLNLKYFNFYKGNTTINKKFEKLFNNKKRISKNPIRKIDQDLAASIQLVFNDILILLAIYLKKITNCKNLVLAGGVALNCVSVGKISEKKIFENIWVQPASGDAGTSLGSALAEYYKNNDRNQENITSFNPFLGPSFTNNEILAVLKQKNINYLFFERDDELIEVLCNNIINEKVVGLFNGRMEFGPRALGARSILADPRSKQMQKKLNLKIKYRESFRPFAPAILIEHYKDHFELQDKSPYMSIVSQIKHSIDLREADKFSDLFLKLKSVNSKYPAITHVDNSARIQTVEKNLNNFFYRVLSKFYKMTGCPMLINTSFNVNEEPIVCTIEDAINCFYSNEIDTLILGNYLISKNGN